MIPFSQYRSSVWSIGMSICSLRASMALPFIFPSVEVEGHRIRLKLAAGRVKVEHDDAAAAARALDVPLRVVMERALAQASADATIDAMPS